MRKHLGAGWLALACVLLFGHLSVVPARGIKHRIKWNRKTLPSTAHVTEARVSVTRPGAFVRHGQKLDVDLGADGNRYYEAHYWQFPDGIHYDGCSDANVTREMLVTRCINATQAANQAEFSAPPRDQQDSRLHQRVLWRLIRELCSAKRCDFWLEGAGASRAGLDQPPVLLGLLVLLGLTVK
ncbi:prion-like protein doppel [Echinops telfairi]|uniref:Prion-like protein doppel n=1 Tax=Echinops telfairi TaxID=9371 RepID=A2BDH6_ECHTE|nr:prion-like protein doppel [Echinops telfairi]CAJ75791.1 TPA: doppel protein Dpl [Echinops telfairi]